MTESSAIPPQAVLPLSSLKLGESAVIDRLEGPPEFQLRLLELGVVPGEPVQLCYKAPLGGPLEIELMNYRLAIRRSDAHKIWIRPVPLP